MESASLRFRLYFRMVGNSEAKGIYKGLHLGLQFIDESDRPARMRRAYTIGAPSIFVNKNGLGRFPEFRDHGVGGSNPLSPTISLWSGPDTWVTECTGYMGNTFGPKGFSSGSKTLVSQSK